MSGYCTLLRTTLFIFLLCSASLSQAQDSSYVAQPSTSQVAITGNTLSEQPLLPEKMLFTQRVFWGPNGLLRVIHAAPLTSEGRQKEQKVRGFMLVAHQVTGYATLAGFVMQGILGAKLSHATGVEYNRLLSLQQTTLTMTNIAYGTTALLSLTAPPKIRTDRKATSGGLKLHGYLSLIHLTGFVATNILAQKATHDSAFRPYQPVAAFTTLAAFAPALIALKF
ncbi:hypothetical protein [Spirosoma radiotolerans]|uniref:hypothetical protein n=1 Tax=Spirosoma radiotolerans TaxID=1379870 RepID=UPI000B210F94|nr:hypothetical protein [Spirosoma radiotolerans]